MDKKQIIDYIFDELFITDIEEIHKLLGNFLETVRKSKKDTKMLRELYRSGKYDSIKDFLTKENFTKDMAEYNALFYETNNLNVYLKLKQLFGMKEENFQGVLYQYEAYKRD